jgi:hypothetical protein
MRKSSWLSLVFVAVLFVSCGKSLPDLEGFDEKSWKEDKDGCGNKRSKMITAIKSEKGKLLSLNEGQVIRILGRPDRNELFTRNQKFFEYFLEPSPECSADSTQSALKLVVRFNAMGLAKEVAVE